MAHATVSETLRSIPLFAACNDRQLEEIDRVATQIEVPEGAVLAREGERGHEFVIIRSGEAVVRKGDEEIARLGPGSFFGEIALLDGGPRTATVVALTPLTLHVVEHREFNVLLEDVPQLAHSMLVGLARRLREREEPLSR